jgi:hypothetical protein
MHAGRGILVGRYCTRTPWGVVVIDIPELWLLVLRASILKEGLRRRQEEFDGEREKRSDLAGEVSECIDQHGELNKAW